MKVAKEWGLTPTVVDSFEWNNGEKTFYGADAVTGLQGQVFLVNGSGKGEIAHEGLHSGLRREILEARKFFELTREIDITEEKINAALIEISDAYYEKLGRMFNPKKDMPSLNEEFAAFLSGMIETGQAEEFFGLTEATNPEIFASWRDFKAAMGANPMPRTSLEGDGPVSYSLDAFPKKPAPLVNDTTADDILRDRSAVNFLTRKGGLELNSDMTQEEKRQAVKEAVERVARHGEGGNETLFSVLNSGETAEQVKLQGEEPGPSSVFKPGEEGKQQEIFKLLGDYRQPDGKFDVEASKQDYKNFLQDVPEKNRMYLEQALDAVESEVSEDPTTIFLYDGKADRIIYNPKNAIFGKYDIGVAFTHELAHRIDKYFVRAAEDARFVQAIQEAKTVIDTDPGMFIRFCKENDREGFCSDILSAICKGEYEFPMEHDTGYWNQSRQAGEIFANLFSMETYQDTEKIEFLRKHFPELIASYEALDFYIH